jgi:hypothetical protein
VCVGYKKDQHTFVIVRGDCGGGLYVDETIHAQTLERTIVGKTIVGGNGESSEVPKDLQTVTLFPAYAEDDDEEIFSIESYGHEKNREEQTRWVECAIHARKWDGPQLRCTKATKHVISPWNSTNCPCGCGAWEQYQFVREEFEQYRERLLSYLAEVVPGYTLGIHPEEPAMPPMCCLTCIEIADILGIIQKPV